MTVNITNTVVKKVAINFTNMKNSTNMEYLLLLNGAFSSDVPENSLSTGISKTISINALY